MPNFQLHKGNYTIIGVALTDYDGNPDLTTAIQVTQNGNLVVEPVVSGPGNREFYVSVPANATVSSTSVINLNATIPATGSGTGANPVTKTVQHVIDAVVPVDRRSATPVPPSAEQLLPHP